MKKIYFLLIALSLFSTIKAQIVNIPDAKFKAKLLAASSSNYIAMKDNYSKGIVIDVNQNGEIEETEALLVNSLNISSSLISSLVGIEKFINLKLLNSEFNQLISLDVKNLNNLQTLQVYGNQLVALEVRGLTNLQSISCGKNKLTSLDLSGLTNLYTLDCYNNQLQTLDVSMLPNIFSLHCQNNLINTLDISNLSKLTGLDCSNNQLIELYLKNGKTIINEPFSFLNNPNLKYICIDEAELVAIQNKVNNYNYTNCQVNSYCSFVPGGTFYTIQGNQKFGNNTNGCDVLDVAVPNLKFNITDGTTTGSLISNTSGNYSIPVQEGTHTITPTLENPAYFNVSPTIATVSFPTQASPFTQNFCITANGLHPDLEITILPLQPARPGFDAKYKIVYKNKGNTTQSGSINLTFNDAVLDLVVANPITSTQTTNNLSWDFTNLKPFESKEIILTLNVNTPTETPAVNNGDVLAYTAKIVSSAIDETLKDNTFTLNQTVVGSFDPNDKMCLEGIAITPGLIGEYVHYMIRFENKGTYYAQNIVVKDMIDLSKFDISTLISTSASHSFVTNISAGNKVEFIFENINLPFDDANNDGYIAFKIKTKSTLVVNDTFTNEASIFFDYNFPIITNKATSTFKTLGTKDFEFANYFTLYPNPVNESLNIVATKEIEVKSIAVYNILGQLVLSLPNVKVISKIDVSNLKTGNYFVKINTDKGSSSMKFIKN
nr:T9SS type A sorting domain-containing protein [uncultured Flavobacterium sp.]